jgi:hypothetical protein
MARIGSPGEDAPSELWRQVLSGGGLVLAVAAVLIFAAVRQSPPPPAPLSRIEPPPAAEAAVEPLRAPVLDPLSRRTLEDPGRIGRSAGDWTLQIAMACQKESAHRLLDRAGGEVDLFVLPATLKGQECFRFCWGIFDSRDAAARATPPASLRGREFGAPAPRRVEDVRP